MFWKKYGKDLINAMILIIGAVMAVAGIVCFYDEYIRDCRIFLLCILTAVASVGAGLLGAAVMLKKADKKKTALSSVAFAVCYGATLWGLCLLISAVSGKELLALVITVLLLLTVTAVLLITGFVRLIDKKTLRAIVCVLVALGFTAGEAVYSYENLSDAVYDGYKAAAPAVSDISETKEDRKMTYGDFFVSTTGNDRNIGTKDAPFLTIERAMEAVRKIDKSERVGITVCIEAGEYRVSSVVFTEENSGTKDCPITYRAYGDGEVVLNGGVTLSAEDFRPVTEYKSLADRLSDEAEKNVVVIDLTKEPYSLTKEDWGKIYAIGSYNTAKNYDGDWTGPLYCELFVNDKRQTVARYPDEGFLYTQEVVSTGLGYESDGALTAVEGWEDIRNPEPDVYKVNEELANRISGWKNPDDVWMFGYWKYDWADASTPIGRFDKATGELSPRFVSRYGTKTDAPYYFFNVLEELTGEGEWYLDRENGLLCMWKSDDFSQSVIDLSLSLEPIINVSADYLIFDGITIKGTRGDAVSIKGNGNTVRNCLIKNVAGNAVIMMGSDNLAYNNEITRTGKGGIIIEGGNTETLEAGNSKADNNYIHDWSEIYLTYQPAVTLRGVGNVCSHNEMANSPHEAITYSGNNHIIEYNNIHEVCLLSDDAGAIYSGRSWAWYGNIIRYNCVYNIGSQEHTPDGIYLDDALSGQQVYGNILVNIPKYAILIGGGRDNIVKNNIIINAGRAGIYYDERAREGALYDGWFTHASLKSGDMWTTLSQSPWQSDIWQNAFPQYKSFSKDPEDSETRDFVPNPANSTVEYNLIFDKNISLGRIDDSVSIFSDISKNEVYPLWKSDNVFTDAENGIYTIKENSGIVGFEDIPLEEIGRIN